MILRFSDDGTPLGSCPTLTERMAAAGKKAGDLWVFCMYCERFFQAKHLRVDFLGNRQGCAFCRAAGFGSAIYAYEVWATPKWPKERDLHHGMRLPEGL